MGKGERGKGPGKKRNGQGVEGERGKGTGKKRNG
jgi:hypothetical protein